MRWWRTSNIQHPTSKEEDGGGVDGNGLLDTVAGAIRDSFVERGVEVAHLKVSLEETDGNKHSTPNTQPSTGLLGAIQWVRTESEP